MTNNARVILLIFSLLSQILSHLHAETSPKHLCYFFTSEHHEKSNQLEAQIKNHSSLSKTLQNLQCLRVTYQSELVRPCSKNMVFSEYRQWYW